jgi:hypothetical protein
MIADKGFAGTAFEQLVADVGGQLLHPDRKDESRCHGSLGPIRQQEVPGVANGHGSQCV